MDQEAGEEDDEGVVDKDQLVGLQAKEQWEKTGGGDTFAGPVNFDLSDNSETEGEENDFYIDDSEPADLKGLMVVYDEETLFQYKHKDSDPLEFEPNNNNNDEFDFKFEEEEDELEFNYEPGISLASLATCACPCLRHHETGHCQQLYVLLARQNILSESLCYWLSHLTFFHLLYISMYTSENSPVHLRLSPEHT